MAAATDSRCWTFTLPSPLGDTHTRFEITADALLFESDDVFGGGAQRLRWDSIREGATSTMDGMGGPGAPDMPKWGSGRIEWLTLKRRLEADADFMQRLPAGDDRDSLVAALRERLGERWRGEGLPLREAHKQMGIASREWSMLKLVGLVVAVLALLVLAILVLGLLLTPVILIPALVLVGAWLVRGGLRGRNASFALAGVSTTDIARAPQGLVHLAGRARIETPLVAPITERRCVWWDLTLWLWYEPRDNDDDPAGWRQIASRHGGTIDTLDIADDSGGVRIWLDDAELLLAQRVWQSDKDTLPAPGQALLGAMGFPWHGSQRLRVTEQCLEVDAPVHVIGTLDARREVPDTPMRDHWSKKLKRSLRTGQWRREVVGAMPTGLRPVLAVFIGFLDLFTRVGTAQVRPLQTSATPPAMPAEDRLVWRGRRDETFIVSDRPQDEALAAMRQRATWRAVIGAGLIVLAFVELFDR